MRRSVFQTCARIRDICGTAFSKAASGAFGQAGIRNADAGNGKSRRQTENDSRGVCSKRRLHERLQMRVGQMHSVRQRRKWLQLRAAQIAAVVQIQNAAAQTVGIQRGVLRRRIRQRRRTVCGAREIQPLGVVQNGQTAADQNGTLHSRYIDAHGFRLRFDHRAVSGGGLRIFGVRAADRHHPPVAAFDDAVGRNDGRAPVGVRVTPQTVGIQTARDFPDLIRARLPGTIARLHRRGVIRRVRRFQIVQIDDLVPRRYFVIPRADGLDIPAVVAYIGI